MMRIDRAEVTWDAQKSKWLVRIQNGDEVVRRHCSLPKDANEQALLNAALKTVQEEGYEADPSVITISRQASAS
ncbi:MAG TPA: hypothetical protein VGT03_10085 [Candidatus Acidoferrales bacterium]|nr:hypothetical protein [Candidatus Acidoferrales bacterium]